MHGEYSLLHILKYFTWKLVQVGYEQKMKILLYLLKYWANKAKDNIPCVVREYLKRMKYNLVCNR